MTRPNFDYVVSNLPCSDIIRTSGASSFAHVPTSTFFSQFVESMMKYSTCYNTYHVVSVVYMSGDLEDQSIGTYTLNGIHRKRCNS